MNLQLFAEKDIKRQPSKTLKKSIKHFEAKIEQHREYINNPWSHCPDWDSKDEREQAGLIRHWSKEIRNFQESIKNRIEELKERGDWDNG